MRSLVCVHVRVLVGVLVHDQTWLVLVHVLVLVHRSYVHVVVLGQRHILLSISTIRRTTCLAAPISAPDTMFSNATTSRIAPHSIALPRAIA
jgi:hypothetical protein